MACAVGAGKREQKNRSSVFPQVSDEAFLLLQSMLPPGITIIFSLFCCWSCWRHKWITHYWNAPLLFHYCIAVLDKTVLHSFWLHIFLGSFALLFQCFSIFLPIPEYPANAYLFFNRSRRRTEGGGRLTWSNTCTKQLLPIGGPFSACLASDSVRTAVAADLWRRRFPWSHASRPTVRQAAPPGADTSESALVLANANYMQPSETVTLTLQMVFLSSSGY